MRARVRQQAAVEGVSPIEWILVNCRGFFSEFLCSQNISCLFGGDRFLGRGSRESQDRRTAEKGDIVDGGVDRAAIADGEHAPCQHATVSLAPGKKQAVAVHNG